MSDRADRRRAVMLMVLSLQVSIVGLAFDLWMLVLCGVAFSVTVYVNEVLRQHRWTVPRDKS